jgi:hypothetical protein
VKRFLKGWRTLLLSALLFIAGLADVFQAVDLSAVFTALGVPSEKVGGAVALVAVFFGVLRYATTTAVGQPEAPKE